MRPKTIALCGFFLLFGLLSLLPAREGYAVPGKFIAGDFSPDAYLRPSSAPEDIALQREAVRLSADANRITESSASTARLALFISAAGLGVTLVLAWLAQKSTRAALQAVHNERLIGIAQARAYLSVDMSDAGPELEFPQPGKILAATFKYTNRGVTPAHHVNHVAAVGVVDLDFPRGDKDLVAVDEHAVSHTTSLAHGYSLTGGAHDDTPLKVEDWNAVKQGVKKICLFGVINYRDVFDIDRQSRFCLTLRILHQIQSGKDYPTSYNWEVAMRHNDST